MTLSYRFPYRSQTMPVMARNVVASSQPLAAQAGVDMLKRGGNAVDAALATAITLSVVEPCSNGIGSDAFCILWDGKQLHGLNASGRSPAAVSAADFAGMDAVPLRGWDSVTVPGCVSAWSELSRAFGILPFEQLFEAAIDYARNGFQVTPIVASAWSKAPETFAEFDDFRVFLPDGRAPRAGELFSNPDQAATLEIIADSHGEDFYRGKLAEKMVATANLAGNKLSVNDLGDHSADWVGTLSKDFRDVTVHEIPPNGQGVAALIALGILENLGIESCEPDSVDSFHLQIEAMKLAFADLYRYVADARYLEFDIERLLDPNYLEYRARTVDPKKARYPEYGLPPKAGTVYLTAADAGGMMVSMIQSNFWGFGSGIVIPGTGISLQNRGAGFSLIDGHPNQIAGSKRPFHTIIPAFALKQNDPLMSFGVMGGAMQAQGHVQMVLRVLMWGQNPQTASDAPRWQVLEDQQVALESGIDPEVVAGLEARGHKIYRSELNPAFSMGGAQLIYKSPDGYIAGSDHRKDGCAAGF
ncbi:MAG: gamma-glutamyltransferase family protein [Pseudomonadota bacterium]